MPLEVRELVIKATVVQDSPAAGGALGSSSGVSPNEQLIKACVDKILEILKERNER